jgi:hypothetical protein
MDTHKLNQINVLKLVKDGYSFRFISKLLNKQPVPDYLIPDKTLLLNIFKNLRSFKAIGEYMGVDDKTIKKWFKYRNLPSTLKEMKKLID